MTCNCGCRFFCVKFSCKVKDMWPVVPNRWHLCLHIFHILVTASFLNISVLFAWKRHRFEGVVRFLTVYLFLTHTHTWMRQWSCQRRGCEAGCRRFTCSGRTAEVTGLSRYICSQPQPPTLGRLDQLHLWNSLKVTSEIRKNNLPWKAKWQNVVLFNRKTR